MENEANRPTEINRNRDNCMLNMDVDAVGGCTAIRRMQEVFL